MKNYKKLKEQIKKAIEVEGFQQARISDTSTEPYMKSFKQWLSEGYHGNMEYLARNNEMRQFPDKLHANTCRVISLRYDYLPKETVFLNVLENPKLANISRYALGKDYHKLIRKKLANVCRRVKETCDQEELPSLDYRVFVDSAPVLESCFAERSGLGWKGKHTLVINQKAGSWFFLGEIFINLPLPIDTPVENQCKDCIACIKVCPTNAIIAPYKLDARRCISYLTIENNGSIPVEFREAIGNRIYGCDDCQLICPWNRYAKTNINNEFKSKNNLDSSELLSLINWSEAEFLKRLEGSPIRRIGYQNWLRNLAVAIGNSPASELNIKCLESKKELASEMVLEHLDWAIKIQEEYLNNDSRNHDLKNKKLIRGVQKLTPHLI